jgi:pyruvate,water dikinase
VDADSSGVAFTLDPVSGDRDVVLVDAVRGLGEGIVSGALTPDHYRVAKDGTRAEVHHAAERNRRIVALPGGGTVEADDDSSAPALTEEEARAVATLAVDCEHAFGCPQDIEWAFAGDRLYLLQSRPITAAKTAGAEPDEWVSEFDTPTSPDTEWTAANIQEVVPGQLEPLSISLNMAPITDAFLLMYRRAGCRVTRGDPMAATFYGRAFLNASFTYEVADQSLFSSADAIREQYYGQAVERRPRKLTWRRLRDYARTTVRGSWSVFRQPASIRRSERVLADAFAEFGRRPPEQRTFDELTAYYQRQLPMSTDVAAVHLFQSGLAGSAFEGLNALCRRWLADNTGTLAATLTSGVTDMDSARISHGLWELSRSVAASPELRDLFEREDARQIWRALEPALVAGEFRARLSEFLRQFGHRAVLEGQVSQPSWTEDIPSVIALVRNYLQVTDDQSPHAVEARARARREQAERDVARRLGWWKRPLFRFTVRRAQREIIAREHMKSILVSGNMLMRPIVRHMAALLSERSLLAREDDVYWLTWPELSQLWAGTITPTDASARIDRRRGENVRNRGVVLPETFRGRPKPLRAMPALDDATTLRGLPVSPGRASGIARVILDPRVDAHIEPGEILVAPVTDAGWTPLFISAAGVVVDIGGPLSHGSTVAREFGLPAVVGVRTATARIKTGDRITVDGTNGVVVLESASSEEE